MNTIETLPVRRFCYRCVDCLAVFFVDDASGIRNLRCACGGACACMGRVAQNRLLQDTVACACDGRCTHARGPSCDCICGGKNHGTGALVEVVVDVGAVPRAKNTPGQYLRTFREANEAALQRIFSRYEPVVRRIAAGVSLTDLARNTNDPQLSRQSHEVFLALADLRRANRVMTKAGRLKALAEVSG